MRKRSQIVFAACGLGLLGMVAWKISKPQEPAYQGKPLSTWLQTYNTGGYGSEHKETDEAIRHMGTNVIPSLLKLLQAKNQPSAIIKCMQFAEKLPILKFHYYSAAQKQYRAAVAFKALGSTAKEAVPQLMDICELNLSISSQIATEDALGSIGPSAKQAVPLLLRNATHPDAGIRGHAAMSLARIHAEPELVVPALINSLNDPYSSPEKWVILNGLGRFGTNAKPAVPTLVALLNGQYPRSVKSAAALALRSIDPEAAAKAGLK